MAAAARSHFAPFNRGGLEVPRVRLVVDDGRNFVQRGGRKFDVIVSEPPNIWVSGVSGLFTQEFYQAARQRLSPGGLLCQWLPLYELDAGDFAAALRTIGSVFPHLMVWTNGAVAIVIASEGPIQPPVNLDQVPPAAFADLASVGVAGDKLLDYLRQPDLSARQVESWRAKGAFVNRDDRPLLEFHCARNLFLQQKQRDAARWRAGLSKDR
jgi:spermidine synthase